MRDGTGRYWDKRDEGNREVMKTKKWREQRSGGNRKMEGIESRKKGGPARWRNQRCKGTKEVEDTKTWRS